MEPALTDIYKVPIPRNFNASSIGQVLRRIAQKQPHHLIVIFDFHYLTKFIDPVGVTFLCNLIEWLKYNNIIVKFDRIEGGSEPLRYLDNVGFFKMYLGKHIYPNWNIPATYMPLQLVEDDEAAMWLNTNLHDYLFENVSIYRHDDLSGFISAISEIFINISDHSKVNVGCIYAQHYPRNNDIHICIADFGVGIPSLIRNNTEDYAHMQDCDLIELACTPHFSTKSSPKNRGAGLDLLLRNITMFHRGKVSIFSGHGYLHCTKGQNSKLYFSKNPRQNFYPGTMFDIHIDTKTFESDTQGELFSW